MALRCIEDNIVGGVLNVNDIISIPNCDPTTVLDRFMEIHPPAQREVPEALIQDLFVRHSPCC